MAATRYRFTIPAEGWEEVRGSKGGEVIELQERFGPVVVRIGLGRIPPEDKRTELPIYGPLEAGGVYLCFAMLYTDANPTGGYITHDRIELVPAEQQGGSDEGLS